MVNESGERLLNLLNDLLDLSKLEAGKMRIDWERADIMDVVEQARKEFSGLFEESGLEFRLQLHAKDTQLWFDPTRILQVLRNLLSNAIKFTPRDRCITVSISDRELAGAAGVEVSVSDEGAGIPEGELEAVFEKFVQSSTTKSGAGGTGLGLAICQQIVDAHGGKIAVRCNQDAGVTFYMILPREKTEQLEDADALQVA